ncbi:hypothetical protein SAMN05216199_2697 [Pedococcus cremeus]|uniref:Gram-positive cocci surface proteins LPxTG domain-containing protein n=1 Tax=Pedococcus cremeus TaxID=587636 RepID=A0A1H9W119_9MICO|nr:hypothetical protein [Pedococcus cremeus]SES27451.1 hypothetical protein SAMN05216199_2697 [Pedococcus cremeus]
MLSTRARTTSLATFLAVAGLGAVAAPAHAAPSPATITVGSSPVDLFEGLKVSGTCPNGSGTAVVTVKQGSDVVAFGTTDVAKTGTWATSVDLWEADPGTATATVNCLSYGTEKPLGEATSAPFTIDLPDFPFDEIEVGVTPQRVAVGGTITVSATCPEGSTLAAVLAGNEDADDAFVIKEVVPGPNGRVSEKVGITGNDGVEPEPGPAVAVIVCGDDSQPMSQLQGARKGARLLAAEKPLTARALEDMMPTALGFADFTILPAVVQPTLPTGPTKAPGTVTTPARSAIPAADPAPATPDRLAMTGSDPAPLAAVGAVLLALGGAAIRRARRA